MSHSTLASQAPALKLSDFTEAHANDFYLEEGKLTIRPESYETINNTLRVLYPQDVILKAGETRRSVLVPGYRYSLRSGKSNTLSLLSLDEKNSTVNITLLDFLNAFCDNLIPTIDDETNADH